MADQKRTKIEADTLHNTNQALKRWHDEVRNGVCFKDYADGRVEIHVHYGIRWRDSDCCQYCVVFRSHRMDFRMDSRGWVVAPAFEYQLAALGDPQEWHKKLMLVGYVALVDEQKGVLVGTNSLIRLHPLDHCGHLGANPVADFRFSPFECGWVPEDGELYGGVVYPAGVLQQDECPKKVIQRAPHVVDTVADEKRPFDKWGRFMDSEAHDMHPSFGIQFFENRIGVSIEEKGGNGSLEYAKVFFCPRDLCTITG